MSLRLQYVGAPSQASLQFNNRGQGLSARDFAVNVKYTKEKGSPKANKPTEVEVLGMVMVGVASSALLSRGAAPAVLALELSFCIPFLHLLNGLHGRLV